MQRPQTLGCLLRGAEETLPEGAVNLGVAAIGDALPRYRSVDVNASLPACLRLNLQPSTRDSSGTIAWGLGVETGLRARSNVFWPGLF